MISLTYSLLVMLLLQASVVPPPLSRDLYCTALAGRAIGLAEMPAIRDDRLRLDLILYAVSKPLGAKVLRDLQTRDSLDLAAIAAKQKSRTGHDQSLLLKGLFIMWIVSREPINSAFQSDAAAKEWLEPYPPSVVMIGAVVADTQYDALAEAVRKTALQFAGPVDVWFRGFKIEYRVGSIQKREQYIRLDRDRR